MILQNKVAIVTGASSGIGYSIAMLFASKGAKVVAGARRETELNDLVQNISEAGGEAVALAGDVSQEAYAAELVDLAVKKYGGLDVAVNNAGILGALKNIPDTSLEEWNEVMSVNLTGAFLGTKYQIPAMRKSGGSIILTSSFVGHTIGMPQMGAYAASKAGMIGLTKALATEYGAEAIRVNALLPGGTDTAAGRQFANTPELIAFVESMHALKRMASPEEIAESALYLASDASRFTTGTAMLVEGGISVSKT